MAGEGERAWISSADQRRMEHRLSTVEAWQSGHETRCDERHTTISKMFDKINDKLDRATWALIGTLIGTIGFLFGKAMNWW